MARPKKQLAGAELRAWNLAHSPPVIHKGSALHEMKQSKKDLAKCKQNYWISRILPGFKPEDEYVEMLQQHSHPKWHLRGYLYLGQNVRCPLAIFRVDKDGNHYLPYRNRSQLKGGFQVQFMKYEFHMHPTRSVYSDIPAREDVYRFIKHDTEVFISIGKTRIGIFKKDRNTELTRQKLEEWETNHRYLISRLRKRRPNDSAQETFRRYSYAALRGLGLKWPDKQSKRRQNWPELFEDLGILLKVIDYT